MREGGRGVENEWKRGREGNGREGEKDRIGREGGRGGGREREWYRWR